MYRAAAATTMLACVLLSGSVNAGPPSDAAAADDALLLAVRLRHEILPDVSPALVSGQDILLPLGELCRILEIGIDVDPQAGTAHGFVIAERRIFHLDVARATVILDGEAAPPFAAGLVRLREDDIYVARSLLEQWLPLQIVIDRHASMLTIVPREMLPIERRRARERGAASVRNASLGGSGSYPKVTAPRDLFHWPAMDVALGLLSTPKASGQGGLTETYAALFAGDLLHMDATLFASGTGGDPFQQIHLSLGRTDPDGSLLGGLHARQVVIGETLFPGLDLVAPASSGPGFLLSNRPVGRATEFDRHTFSGPLSPGWDIELYRDGELLGYSRPAGTACTSSRTCRSTSG